MISLDTYRAARSSKGRVLGEVRKTEADRMIDKTFHLDVNYRVVYLQIDQEEFDTLSIDDRYEHSGYLFKKIDCKYQRHAKQSILSDQVDYYLQFRPGVKTQFGRYVIVPDEQSFEPDFDDPEQWWMVVLNTDTRQFPQYMILQCNWTFKWIYEGQLYSALGCLRNSNSYTSGQWTADISTTVDDTAAAWLPDTPETQTIPYDCRFMLSYNKIHPRVYKVTKNNDTTPPGIIKLNFKQDFYNKQRDHAELGICDYYDESGHERLEPIDDSNTVESYSTLYCAHSTLENHGSFRWILVKSRINFIANWSWVSANSSDPEAYTIVPFNDKCKIIANHNIDLVGDQVTVILINQYGTTLGEITLEVTD